MGKGHCQSPTPPRIEVLKCYHSYQRDGPPTTGKLSGKSTCQPFKTEQNSTFEFEIPIREVQKIRYMYQTGPTTSTRMIRPPFPSDVLQRQAWSLSLMYDAPLEPKIHSP